MPVYTHLEALTSGMRARLDTRYRSRNTSLLVTGKIYRGSPGRNSLGDMVGKNRNTLSRNTR